MTTPRKLTVQELDQVSILLAAQRDVSKREFITADLAAYCEWYWLRRANHRLGILTHTPEYENLHSELQSQRESWSRTSSPAMGFVRVRREHDDSEHLVWVQFRTELERALIGGGFTKQRAKQIVGALGELEDNIHLHSQDPRTGLLTYKVSGGELECVILDRGIGVLASLRQSNDFASLSDHGTALQTALAPGNSRFGAESGHGWGFRDLFVGLVNSNAQLRFRSGDHLLSIEGDPDQSLTTARVQQRASGQGFLVALRAVAKPG